MSTNHVISFANPQQTVQCALRTRQLNVFRRRNDSDCHRVLNHHGSQLKIRSTAQPQEHMSMAQHKSARACLYENLNTGYAATTKTLTQDTTNTRYSRVIMNCSNCKGRGRQTCTSLYGPAPGASPPLRHDSANDHTTALSSSSRRAPLQRHMQNPLQCYPASHMCALHGIDYVPLDKDCDQQTN